MEYRYLGRTGVKVSPFVWKGIPILDPTPEEQCATILKIAVEVGINLIKTGDIYAQALLPSVLTSRDENHEIGTQLGRANLVTPSTEATTTYPAAAVLYDSEGNVIWQAPPGGWGE